MNTARFRHFHDPLPLQMALTPPTPTALKDLNLATVKTWDDFTVKVIPCLNVLVDGKILA